MKGINYFKLEDTPKGSEFVETVVFANSDCLRIEKIVSNAATSEEGFWYDQNEDEWLIVLEGSAVLKVIPKDSQSEQTIELKKGDTLLLEAHMRHRVESTSSNPHCIWLCVFSRDKLKLNNAKIEI